MNNTDIRISLISHNVKHWEVARAMGMKDSAFSRLIREELTTEKRAAILKVIEEIAAARKEAE